MITWGVIAMGMAFVKTPFQFYAMRFLLGAAEAGFFPGVLYYVTLWFPEAHRARAITRFYFAVPLGAAAMGAVAGSLLGLQGTLGLAGWQWLFLAQGLPAVLLSVVVFFTLPDRPSEVTWLSEAEKAWLVRRLDADGAGRSGDHPNPFRALLSPTIAALVAVNFLALGSGYAFTLSAPQIVRGATGLSASAIGYVAAGANLIGAALILTNGWLSDRTGERNLFVAAPLLAVAAALGLLAATDGFGAVLAGYVVFTAGNVAAIALFFTTPGAILHPRSAAVGVAAINSLGQIGSFVIPALFGVARDATGSYHAGLAVLAGGYGLAAVIILVLRARTRRAPAPAVG
jgi:ACS family tartrate transporter-like MFS transporter